MKQKLIVGMICLLLVLAIVPVKTQSEPVKYSIFTGGYSWGSHTQFYSMIRFHTTGDIPAEYMPIVTFDITVRDEYNSYMGQVGSPAFPDYTFTLRAFNTNDPHAVHSPIVIWNQVRDLLDPQPTTIPGVENVSLVIPALTQNDDGWYYLMITFEGRSYGVEDTFKGTTIRYGYLATVVEDFYYWSEYIEDVNYFDPWNGWEQN